MTDKEFEKWVQEETDYSVLDVADVNVNDNTIMIDVESIRGIAETYHKQEVNAISDDDIADCLNDFYDDRDYADARCDGFSDGIKWFKNKLNK